MVFYGQKGTKTKRIMETKPCGSKSSNSQRRGSVSNSSQFSNQFASKDEPFIYQICNKRNHAAIKCFNHFNHSYTIDSVPQRFVAIKLEDSQETTWHPDTGATYHMTNNVGNLHYLTPYHGSEVVIVGNWEVMPTTHIRQATFGTGSS